MKYFFSILTILFLFPTFALADDDVAASDEWVMNVNGLVGVRALDQDDWSPAEEQGLAGVEFDFGGKEWPVHILMGFMRSGYDASDERTHILYI